MVQLEYNEPGEIVDVLMNDGLNHTRFDVYLDAFGDFFEDRVRHPQELIALLHDAHWPEVHRALAVAVYRASRKCTIRATVIEEFELIYQFAVFTAFASCKPEVVPSWFLVNTDTLVRESMTQLLDLASDNAVSQIPHVEAALRVAFRILIGIAGIVGKYTSVSRLNGASGAHVVLVVCDDEQNGSFIRNGLAEFGASAPVDEVSWQRPITHAHVVLMDTLSQVLLEQDHSRDVETWTSAFGHFAGHDLWRSFAGRCLQTSVSKTTCANIQTLEDEVRVAFANTAVEKRRALLQVTRTPLYARKTEYQARKRMRVGFKAKAWSSSSESDDNSSTEDNDDNDDNNDEKTVGGFPANKPLSEEAIEMLLDEAETLKNCMNLNTSPSSPALSPSSSSSSSSPASPPRATLTSTPSAPAAPLRPVPRARSRLSVTRGGRRQLWPRDDDEDEELWKEAKLCPDPTTCQSLLAFLYPEQSIVAGRG